MLAPDEAWLGRFVAARLLSTNGRFRILTCRDRRSARRIVIVTPDPDADLEASRAALGRLHAAHSTVEHFTVAPSFEAELAGPSPYVAFDVPAQLDLATLLALARRRRGHKVEHAEADAFIFSLREGLAEAATCRDPFDGGPLCVGALAHTNILFALDGRFWLLGLGHNVAACDEYGEVGARTTCAPREVLLGERGSPIGDYIALLKLSRSMLEFVRLSPVIVGLIKGTGPTDHVELFRLLTWLETDLFGVPPDERPSVEECVEVAWKIRRILGNEPDLDGFRASVARTIELEGSFDADGPAVVWRVAADGSWLEREDVRVELRSVHQRRILRALLRAHLDRPGSRLGVRELLEAGWPGERVRERAGRNRVYVAVNGLRRNGLGGDLDSTGGGYRLSPTARWIVEDMVDLASE